MSKLNSGNYVTIVRWGLVVVLTFFISHYLSYGKLPFFSKDYAFPLKTFLIIGIYGILICQANTIIYNRLNGSLPFQNNMLKRLLYQFGLIWLSTLLIFSFLQLTISVLIFNQSVTFYSFSFYLSICLFIATFEGLAYTLLSLYVIFKTKPYTQIGNSRITIKTNGKMIKFDFEEVSYIHSKGGIVTLVDINRKKYITHFNALQELEELVPKEEFFRVNRQYLIHRKVVKSVEDCDNRKLRLHLVSEYMNGLTAIPISRYKSSDFKKWFRA